MHATIRYLILCPAGFIMLLAASDMSCLLSLLLFPRGQARGDKMERSLSISILLFTPQCKTPPNARANSRVRAIKIIRCLEVSNLGFKF